MTNSALPRLMKPRCMVLIMILGLGWVSLLPAQSTVVPFYDMNQNGIRDGNEPEVKSLTVTVSPADSNQVELRVRLVKTYELVVTPADSTASLHRQATLDSPQLLPTAAALYPNYPNPFNPTTTLRFDLPHDAVVSLKILDIRGAEVMTLVEGERKAGSYTVGFEASGLPSGVYFAKFRTGDYTETRRLVLMK